MREVHFSDEFHQHDVHVIYDLLEFCPRTLFFLKDFGERGKSGNIVVCGKGDGCGLLSMRKGRRDSSTLPGIPFSVNPAGSQARIANCLGWTGDGAETRVIWVPRREGDEAKHGEMKKNGPPPQICIILSLSLPFPSHSITV